MFGDGNTLVYSRPGYSKYNYLLVPYLLRIVSKGESFFATDPEEVLLPRLGNVLKENGYSVISINLRRPNKSNCWNPLSMPYEAYKAGKMDICINLLIDIATNIMTDHSPGRNDDPFWISTSVDLFTGLALVLFKEANNISQVNLKSIYHMAQRGFERFSSTTIIREYFAKLSGDYDIAENAIYSVMTAPSDTRSSIVSVLTQKLRSFTSKDEFMSNLSIDDFHLEDIVDHKSAIFLCYEDEKTTNVPFINIFVRQIYELLVKSRTAKMNCPIYNFVFNCFLTLRPLPEFENMMISSSNRSIRMMFDIGSLNLLNRLYGKETAEFIMSFCPIWLITTSRETEFLNQLESLIKLSKQDETQLLKSPFELADEEVMVVRDGKIPEIFKAQSIAPIEDDYKHEVHWTSRNKIELFRIDEYVKERIKVEIFNPTEAAVGNLGEAQINGIISKIDRKIAELEIQEKLENAKESSTQDIRNQ